MNKLFNKILMTALLTGLLMSVSSADLKSRTFFSVDKSKSFEGTLTAYNGEDNKVRVRTSKGRDITFMLSFLSEKCQAYVTENASMLAVVSSLDISFEEVKEKKVKGADGVNTTFDVIFYNRSKTIIKGMVVDYTVYYSKDALKNGKRTTSKLTSTGSFDVYDLVPRYRTTETTQKINIVHKTIADKGGG